MKRHATPTFSRERRWCVHHTMAVVFESQPPFYTHDNQVKIMRGDLTTFKL